MLNGRKEIKMTTVKKYAIKYKDSNSYLDKYDCETTDIAKAMLFDTYKTAKDCRDTIDVAYLFEVVEIEIIYKVKEINI
jgi:hypothetical protein